MLRSVSWRALKCRHRTFSSAVPPAGTGGKVDIKIQVKKKSLLSTSTVAIGAASLLAAGAGYAVYLDDPKVLDEYFNKIPLPLRRLGSQISSSVMDLFGTEAATKEPVAVQEKKVTALKTDKKVPPAVPVKHEVKETKVQEPLPVYTPIKEDHKTAAVPLEEKVVPAKGEKVIATAPPVKVEEDNELIIKNLLSEIAILEDQIELVSQSAQAQRQTDLGNFLRAVDAVATEFQKALDSSRSDVTELIGRHSSELSELKKSFDERVDMKVSQEVGVRAGEMRALSAAVDDMRRRTGEFGDGVVLGGHVLDIVKYLNTVPYTAAALRDSAPPLDTSMEKLKQRMVARDEFVETVVKAMPEEVDSVESLRGAYAMIRPRLYQISLVPEEGGGMISYIISRLFSPFMFKSTSSFVDDKSGGNVDRIGLVDNYIKQGRLMDALDVAVKLNQIGWNSVVMQNFVERLRRRVEFDMGLWALEAHLGLVSSRAVRPRLHLDY